MCIAEMERQAVLLARALGVRGLMNIQFAVKDGLVYLIEVNPRASRTVPFVAKAIGQPIAKLPRGSWQVRSWNLPTIKRDIGYMAVKEAVFPFARFPRRRSGAFARDGNRTGEVMGIDSGFPVAFRRGAMLGARAWCCPQAAPCSCRLKDSDKPVVLPAVREARRAGLPHLRHGRELGARSGAAGVKVERVNKVAEGRPRVVDPIIDGDDRADLQHHRRLARASKGFAIDPGLCALWQGAFFQATGSVAAAEAIEALGSTGLAGSVVAGLL